SLLAEGDRRGGLAGCRRAAGMGVNAMMALGDEPLPGYGRSYMDHLTGLTRDDGIPLEVREAAMLLLQTPMPGGEIVGLRTSRGDTRLVDATRTVLAQAYTLVVRAEARGGPDEGG